MGTLSMIAALGEDNALGLDNDLLWHLPDDFKRFKRITSGHKIIMGRKTFESFPSVLPNRTHIIITRDRNYDPGHEKCIVVHSLEDALSIVANDTLSFVIGGGEIYSLAMKYATELEVTRVHGTFKADSYFPVIDKEAWELVNEEFHAKDEKHAYAFTYRTYKRKGQ